jgi:hypothetical protein
VLLVFEGGKGGVQKKQKQNRQEVCVKGYVVFLSRVDLPMMYLNPFSVIDLHNGSKKRRIASKSSLELVDWVLAIDFDLSTIPASADYLLETDLKV